VAAIELVRDNQECTDPYREGFDACISGGPTSDPDNDVSELTFTWDFGDDSDPFVWQGVEFMPPHEYADGDRTYTVTLTVTDPDGNSDTATQDVFVANVAPIVEPFTDATLESGDTYELVSGFDDPGADAPWEWTIDWGDGTVEEGAASIAPSPIGGSHRYLIPDTYTVTVSVTDKDGAVGTESATVEVTLRDIIIDIKPGSDENPINLRERGVTPVAIVTTTTFDALTIDRTTIQFGNGLATPVHDALGHAEDFDQDGDVDLVTHFTTGETGIAVGDTDACLTGVTVDGVQFIGCDVVRVINNEPKGKGKGRGDD
jgi:PKD repeat protein